MQNTNLPLFCNEIERTREMKILGKTICVKNYICSEDGFSYQQKTDPIKMQMTICPTSFCSGTCPFCIATETKKKQWIDQKKLEYVLLELKKEDCIRGISITGGEPFTDIVLLNEILEMIYQIFGTEMEVNINTNGFRLSEIHKIPRLFSLEALHISRHHYKEDKNQELFGIPLPSNEELKEILHSVVYKDLFVLNCLLMKDYIGNREEAYRYLDFAIEMGAGKVSFITPQSVNTFVKEQAVEFSNIFSKQETSLLYTRGYQDFEFCRCQDGIYVSETGELMRFYGKTTRPDTCQYTRAIVYGADNLLRCNYAGDVIF